MGLDTIKANHRRDRRREFKQAIKPQFKPGPVTGSVVFTKKTKERLAHHANELFGDKGWAIGGVWLRDMTREQLLDRAQVERKSAKGSLQNAQFYEALAQPLSPGQPVYTYWQAATAAGLRDQIWADTEGKSPRLE